MAYNILPRQTTPTKINRSFYGDLSQEILQKTMFPLAGKLKTEVRKYAAEMGFYAVSERKDSLGVCFLGNDNYRPFVINELKKRGITIPQGTYINSKGEYLGSNQGYVHYTIGQRKNLGLHTNARIFVKQILPKSNQVVLSEYSELYRTSFEITNVYFHNVADISKQLIVKIRYRMQANACTLTPLNSNTFKVHVTEPLESIAPGQTAVFYIGTRVVGGGFIR